MLCNSNIALCSLPTSILFWIWAHDPPRMNFLSFYLNGRTRPRAVIIFMGTCRPESLRIWISHPRNRRNIESDLLILTLLTIVTVGLATVCLLGEWLFYIWRKRSPVFKSKQTIKKHPETFQCKYWWYSAYVSQKFARYIS